MGIRPPGPNGVPLFGSGRQYAKDPFTFLTQVSEAYGDVVRFGLGPLDTYMLTNPADIERVLVTDDARYRKPDFQDDAIGTLLGDGLLLSEGEAWRKQRELAQPAFGPGRISALGETMTDHAEAMVDDWADGEVRDVQSEMARVTVKIIVDAMFGSSLADERVELIQENLEPLGKRFEPNPMRFLVPDWAPTRENREYAESVSVLEDIIDDVVSERRGTENDPSAAVTRGEDGDGGANGNGAPMDLLSVLLRAQARGEQTDRQIRDEMMTMLLAGHDTTALTLTYTWYLLSQHPEAEATVQEEVAEVCGGETPTAADVRRFDYVERVIQEAMRLYPPVYTIFREPQVDVRLGGYRIPEGSAVMLPQWVVHRSPRWYDAPTEFDPDRWLPARRANRPRFSYFPFGGGPRHCIGKRFSMMEAQLILATVVREYELDYVREEPFDLRGSLTMHPEEPMGMRLKRRD